MQVYREWTRDREPILTERPKKICLAAGAAATFELLPSAGGGAWAPELLRMLQAKTELPTGGSFRICMSCLKHCQEICLCWAASASPAVRIEAETSWLESILLAWAPDVDCLKLTMRY